MAKPLCQQISSFCGACFPQGDTFITLVQSAALLVRLHLPQSPSLARETVSLPQQSGAGAVLRLGASPEK